MSKRVGYTPSSPQTISSSAAAAAISRSPSATSAPITIPIPIPQPPVAVMMAALNHRRAPASAAAIVLFAPHEKVTWGGVEELNRVGLPHNTAW